ncbi:YgiW/YdeI family stress tolerance OB fold protein [Mesorhizobium sp. ZC-5]|uniref:YgiW/YdeI family stress tolerance OB fold protein n=1 Tax=Mesorhizobium sp. ZC-5 TaxID=2986066 RepID=UPI0021E6E18F|nr:NirD/YgiW/YdeI family stress tolerance protein [Mesorhizobium sp. ZC-5]MCV3238940.1 NirD/YgiW/YdeI family stress tolerance protein [Mesorhizobium sp. ZC-5]
MKRILVTLFLSAFLATSASAQFVGPSSSKHLSTVEQARTARRGQDVTLEGYVVKHLRGTYYIFRDATGEMRTEINRHLWRNRKVTSKTPIRLIGKVDRDVRELYVRAVRLEIPE